MAFARPFAYNTGATIPGTEQIGNLSIGYPTSGFTNNPQYWNGPDEELGYVIAQSVSGNTQPTQVPDDAVTLSTTYKGTDISVTNNNQTAAQIFGYQQSVLGETIISGTNQVMFSVLCDLLEPNTLIGSHLIGVGTTSMNYSSQFGAYPGNDIYSIGFSDDGNYYFDGGVVASGLPTWTDGDTIDIAISHGQYWWVRVNGGDWNNNPSANPTTLTNGLTMNGVTNFYPVLCPSYQGIMTLINYPKYGVPSDYNFLGNVTASVGFFRSDDLTEGSFIEISEAIAGQSFATGNDAKTWLNNNGYWTSYEATPDPTPTPTETSVAITPTPTPTVTGTLTPTPTPTSGATPSGFNITISEVGSNVVMSASGTLNINDLTLVTPSTGPLSGGGLGISSATFILGSNGQNFAQYSGITSNPSNFGSGSGAAASSSSGDVIGVVFNSTPPYLLSVPVGYTTGTYISSTQTFNSQSFSSLGLVSGTYTYTWGSGANEDSINVVVGGPSPTPTPTPTSGATTDGWLLYYPEGPVTVGPPINDGNAIFLSNPGTIGVYNPNYTGGTLDVYFNENNSVGTSYLTQFQGLDVSGGTLTVSQGSNTVIYSGTSSQYNMILPDGFLVLQVSNVSQMVQSASTPFVSGTTINLVVN